MNYYPGFLLFLLLSVASKAQPSLCLSADNANSIIFKSAELNDYMHLEQYKVIFFGEQHNAKFDPQFKYFLITDLNARAGIRHVFIESSVSNVWRLNRYLQTGDTSYLSYSSTTKPGPYTTLWKKLYDYNKGLPDSLKIIFYGFDFETTAVFQTLQMLSQGRQPVPASLQPVVDTINAHVADAPLRMWSMTDGKFNWNDNSSFVKTLRYVQDQLLANADDASRYFGINYPVVKDIAANRAPVEVAPKQRNKAIFAAMERVVQEQHIDKFIGFFGLQHTTYTTGYSLANTAKRLKGIKASDILNIGEVAYDLKAKDTTFRTKHFREIVSLNGSCRASLLTSDKVPGFEKDVDFIFICNITE